MTEPCGNMWKASATQAERNDILREERKRRRDVGARQLKALGSTLSIERSKYLDAALADRTATRLDELRRN
jgi:hypothetical protein